VYTALVRAYEGAVKLYMSGKVTIEELQRVKAPELLREGLQQGALVSKHALPEGLEKHLVVEVRHYNSFGENSQS